jgi:hypothetical protein
MLARQLSPHIETVALVWQFAGADCDAIDDECSLEAGSSPTTSTFSSSSRSGKGSSERNAAVERTGPCSS